MLTDKRTKESYYIVTAPTDAPASFTIWLSIPSSFISSLSPAYAWMGIAFEYLHVRSLLSLRKMLSKRENPNFLFPSHCSLSCFSVVSLCRCCCSVSGCLSKAIWASLQLYLSRIKPSSVSVVCSCFAGSPAALEFCLIRNGAFVDRSIPVQICHPVLLQDICMNNLPHFLESQF